MFPKPFELLRQLIPVWAAASPFAGVYCLLLCVFPDAIAASQEFQNLHETSGGPDTLFAMTSVLLGLTTMFLLERNLQTIGAILFLFALPVCVSAVAGGFALALLFLKSTLDPMCELAGFSLIIALGTCMVQIWWVRMIN